MIYIKNPSEIETVEIRITSSKTKDIGALGVINILEEFTRSEIAKSDDLCEKIKVGTVIINDGVDDLNWLKGIELVRDYKPSTVIDSQGKWVVRADSKPADYDTCFTGAGDDISGEVYGGGQEFVWDWNNTDNDDPSPPTGRKRKIIEWQFLNGIFLKEGTIYPFNMPKGSFVDMYVICPDGQYYYKKSVDANGVITKTLAQASGDVEVAHWVIHYHLESTIAMGDELNTESASDVFLGQHMKWKAVFSAPDSVGSDAHGHFTLEMYRPKTVNFPT